MTVSDLAWLDVPRWAVHTHGYGGYTRGCRCDTCRAAKAEYMRTKRAAAASRREQATARGQAYVAQGVYHGTSSSYKDASCRCGRCRTAVQQAKKQASTRKERH